MCVCVILNYITLRAYALNRSLRRAHPVAARRALQLPALLLRAFQLLALLLASGVCQGRGRCSSEDSVALLCCCSALYFPCQGRGPCSS